VVNTKREGDELLIVLWDPRGPEVQIRALQSRMSSNLTTTACERECNRTDRRVMLLVGLIDF
jgi:hypothetical protein